ncbi:MAG TPA: XRE family transcriptional regulator [Phycisphaerae bacterium]|nr:XRE family transcriptional regulator [Phycisphaerae bacterium]
MPTIHDHANDVVLSLGNRLHAMRESRGWTLEELAERTGLSKPYLSRIEAGDRQPSIAALLTVATAFGVSIAALFEQPDDSSDCIIVRGGTAPATSANGLSYSPLSSSTKPFNLQPLAITVPATRKGNETYQHDGEEWLYVTAGKLQVTVADNKHILNTGDSAHFDSRLPHRLDALDGKDATILLVACPIPLSLNHRRAKTTAATGRLIG